MFSQNTGTIDRTIRVILGLALIGAFFYFPELSWRWILLIGVVPLLTGLAGSCPLYSLLGINTCQTKRS